MSLRNTVPPEKILTRQQVNDLVGLPRTLEARLAAEKRPLDAHFEANRTLQRRRTLAALGLATVLDFAVRHPVRICPELVNKVKAINHQSKTPTQLLLFIGNGASLRRTGFHDDRVVRKI